MWNSHKMKDRIRCSQRIKVANKISKYIYERSNLIKTMVLVLICYSGDKNRMRTFQTIVSQKTTTWWLKIASR